MFKSGQTVFVDNQEYIFVSTSRKTPSLLILENSEGQAMSFHKSEVHIEGLSESLSQAAERIKTRILNDVDIYFREIANVPD